MSHRSLPLKDSLANVASPLRQTSMLNRSGNDSSVLLQVDLQNVRKELVNRHNDDDAEQSELRRSAELQMLQQEVTPTSEKQRSIGSLEEPTAAQSAEHYYNCIKLSAENKVNAKNAFSLQLIDDMAMMLKRKDPKMDNFELASYYLDASTKIYAHRVDCVLADARKMAHRLAVGECNIQPERDEGEGCKETKRKDDEDDAYCEELVELKMELEDDDDDDHFEELVKPNGVPLPAQLQDVHNAATLDEFAGDNLIAAPPSKDDEDISYCEELLKLKMVLEDEDDDHFEELVKPNGVPLPAQLQDVHNAATLDEFAGDNLIAAPPSKDDEDISYCEELLRLKMVLEDEDDDHFEELVKPNGVPLPAQLQDVHNAATLDEFAGDNLIAAPPSKSSSPNTREQDIHFQEEGET